MSSIPSRKDNKFIGISRFLLIGHLLSMGLFFNVNLLKEPFIFIGYLCFLVGGVFWCFSLYALSHSLKKQDLEEKKRKFYFSSLFFISMQVFFHFITNQL